MDIFDIAIIATAIVAGTLGFFGCAIFNVGKSRGQYNRGWNAGRDWARSNQEVE